MDKKLKHLVELPSWIKRTAKENSSKLPLANPEHEVAIDNAQAYLTGLAERFDQLPKGEKISIWNTPAFIEKAKTSSPELMVITLYEDLINTSVLLNRLAIQRTMELAKSFVRSTRTNEIYVQAITGRSILEMGIVVADSMRAALDALFKKIADAPKGSLPVYEDTETFNFKVDIEESIYKAAFGTRIGGGTFGNKKTSIWGESPVSGEIVSSKNIMSHFQRRAKKMANNDGITDMRIYELLCDVIHPSAFGYDFYYAPAKDSETHLNYKLEKNWMDKEKTDFISTAALYAASHGCGLIIEIFDHIDKYELQAMDNLDQCKKALQASQ